MTGSVRHNRMRENTTWPGFVDALAALLMVIIFVLMLFVVAQFYLTQALSGRDKDLLRLQNQINELGELLSCLLYTSPSPRDKRQSRMPSSA